MVAPLFVMEGCCVREEILSMPGYYRLSVDELIKEAVSLAALGIPAVALFPVIDESLKDPLATEALNPEGLYPRAIRRLKEELPELVVISDVALDPYSSVGHDGIVRNGEVINDETLEILANMAVLHAEAGADVIAPSQMDPANVREALREVLLDIEEGADMVMIKPAHAYLDVITRVKEAVDVPVAAYHVSGEYAMIMAAVQHGWLDERSTVMEVLTGIKRAGADIILTYFARKAAKWLQS